MERVGGSPPTASLAQGGPSGPAGGFAVEDRVDLSETARSFLASADHAAGPGKSMESAAHKARAIIAENPHLANMPFGQVVSQLNHGTLDLTPPAAPGDGGEAGNAAAVADTAGGLAGIPAADGEAAGEAEGEGAGSAILPAAEDGIEAAMDGDGAPILQPSPEDGPDAAPAGDGAPAAVVPEPAEDGPDPVAGDDGSADGSAVADGEGEGLVPPAAPVVSVDTTATLLDMLNGSDEAETEPAA